MADQTPIIDTDRVTITKGDTKTDFWLEGRINDQPGYTFIAKVYDVGSPFGINGGQISKLEVSRNGEIVCSYSRGWDEQPSSAEDRRAVDTIVSSFREREPTRTVSRRRARDEDGRER